MGLDEYERAFVIASINAKIESDKEKQKEIERKAGK